MTSRKKKTLMLALILVFVVGIIAAFATVTGAESVPAELSIDYCNLSFKESVYVKYAVKSNVSNVSLLIWTSPKEEYVYGTQETEIVGSYNDTIGGEKYYVFDYKGISAREMGDAIYARAYANVGGKAYYSEICKYSVLQYVYNMTGKTGELDDDEDFVNLLNNMLLYGASAQTYFNYKTDRLVTKDFYQVLVEGGLLADKTAEGLYLPGDKLIIKAPETDASGATFSHWADADGRKVASTATAEIEVKDRNEVYTAVYVKYSVGLEFENIDYGICTVIGMGDCTDTDVVIPTVSPDGDIVTEIDRNAFKDEDITSISLPSTIEYIGRNAFSGCDYLTDVYYDGSKADFESNVDVQNGNDALLDATFHFSVVTKYTVTFVDYNGATLKTESVIEGASATAPAAPQRDGYTFTGWDKDFSNITEDITVTATYEAVSYDEPTIVVDSVKANAGDTVTVAVRIVKNPGILAMTLSLSYDESALTLVGASNGDALSMLTMTPSKTLQSGCKFGWDGVEITQDDICDGDILLLTFKVADNASVGSYDVIISYKDGDIYDNDINILALDIKNGSINVE